MKPEVVGKTARLLMKRGAIEAKVTGVPNRD
jgi:hypothetical protein